MIATGIERAAYIAAHRIIEADTAESELVCPGARRSRAVDAIAEIIRDVFAPPSPEEDEWAERERATHLHVVNPRRRRDGVLRIPSRPCPHGVA